MRTQGQIYLQTTDKKRKGTAVWDSPSPATLWLTAEEGRGEREKIQRDSKSKVKVQKGGSDLKASSGF